MSEELDRAMQEAQRRLADRGVSVSMRDDSNLVAQVLEAVEQFEREVERQGGDLMVDTGYAEQPDDPKFLLPKRAHGETLNAYSLRVEDATRLLKRSAR
jgi:hypothetical protein